VSTAYRRLIGSRGVEVLVVVRALQKEHENGAVGVPGVPTGEKRAGFGEVVWRDEKVFCSESYSREAKEEKGVKD